MKLNNKARQDCLHLHLAYWIQVSGASALAAAEIVSPDYIPGSSSDSVYDDESGIADIRAVIQAHPFRAVDNFILNTVAESSNIRSALVFPPIIYGQGQGPINQRSIQVPELSRVTLEKKHGVRIGEGSSRWGNVHIRDIGSLFLALAEAALARRDDEQLWGKNGLYLTGVGELVSQFNVKTQVLLLTQWYSHSQRFRPR